MDKKTRRLCALLTGILTAGSCASGLVPEKDSIKEISASAASSQLLAFPGAVGGGKFATGGRGGEVYHVTNLNDSGEGSLRDAVSKSNRIVVFDVSGTIELKGNILCQNNITIAGQTAPGGSGITLKNYKMGMSGDNIICRYISSRPGPYASTSSGNDAWGGAKGSNSIIDHCSMGWTTDEQWGLYSNNLNYTVQYSVLGPADSWGGHKKGLHGFGIMLGKGNLTFDHNLIIHNVSRNFRGKIPDQYTADFTNNIIYDWGYQTAYGTIGHLNYVNNTLKAGKSTTGGYHWMYVDSTTKPQNFKVYCAGNRLINKDGSFHSITNDNWSGVTVKDSIGITKNDLYSASPFQININGENASTATTCESAAASYDHVIAYAGNGISSNKRTAIDQQCANETKNGTGSCSGTSAYDSSVTDLNKYSIQCGVTYNYPSAVLKKEIVDNDNDGMADDWELARGLDPNDPSDYKGDYCNKGYMNIEYYINDLTVDSFPKGVVELSPTGTFTPVPSVSAFETIEAESYKSQENVRTEDLASGGQNIGYITNGSWAMYRKVDFGDGARSFKGLLSGNAASIELYLDSLSGTPAATIKFPGTSGFSEYKEIEATIPQITGTHDLYLKFTGGDGYLLNADRFVFGKEDIPIKGSLISKVSVNASANPMDWKISSDSDVGSLVFGDRDFAISSLPDALKGGEVLLTSCNAKGTTGDTAVLTAGEDIDLYVLIDSRVENDPDFLSGTEAMTSRKAEYTSSDFVVTTDNGVTFMPYKKSLKKGETFTLGSNGQTYMCVNFFAMAVPSSSKTQIGDINADGSVNIADLVMLQKYLLRASSLTSEQGAAADFDNDGIVDSFDALLLKRTLIKALS